LFLFIEDSLLHLDAAEGRVLANFALFFTLHLAGFFGFRIQDAYSERNPILDLREGRFVPEMPQHGQALEAALAFHTAQLLRVQRPEELLELPLNQETRRQLLQAYQTFYSIQIPEFGEMKTLGVLQTVLS
ncbi:MAG TPA: hypothetical protein VKU83_05940, partial [Puia sp.]|nr:hypothetical protein [Puia sp.]